MAAKSVEGNCATAKPRQLDNLLSRKQTAQQLCQDCPLQHHCIAMLLVARDRNSCMGGLNYEERLILHQQLTGVLQQSQLSASEIVSYLHHHPEVLNYAQDEYRRRQRNKRNSLRSLQYTREYMSGHGTLTTAASNPVPILYY